MKVPRTRRWRTSLAAVTAVALGGFGLAALASTAAAAPVTVDNASLTWSINDEAGGGAYFGGCNFLSAGEAGDSGSSRLWTEADGFYAAEAGNVSLRKPDGAGGWVTPTWSTKCQDSSGAAVNTKPGSTTGTEVVFANGAGTIDTEAGTAELSWDGAVTIAFYGGMTYWSITNPVLTVADGIGTITGTASGYGADMYDTSKWVKLEPRQIDVATLQGVEITDAGLTVTPDYLGVEVEVEEGGPSGAQKRNGDYWGSFPQSFIDFNVDTGQAAYWYSSGGQADPKKPTNELTVSWEAGSTEPPTTEPPTSEPPAEDQVDVDVEVPETNAPEPEPEFSWVIEGDRTVSMGQASVNEDNSFSATGTLPNVTVIDTRPDGPQWSLTGQATAFTSETGSIEPTALGWTPAVGSENSVGAVPGAATVAGEDGLATASTLAQAPQGHPLGRAVLTAELKLLAPAGTPAGAYSSTITVTALS